MEYLAKSPKGLKEKFRQFIVNATDCNLHNGWPCATCLFDLCKRLGVPLTYQGERPKTCAIHFPALIAWISRMEMEDEHENA
jgi:hypothetical protein